MTIDEAERAFDPPLVRPQIDVASDATIVELWVRPSPGGQVSIVYDSNIIVSVRPWNRGIKEMAEAFIAEDPANGKLISIRGVDVFTAPPQRPCFGGNAVFNVGGAHVAVVNDGELPYPEVWRVARSVLDTAPGVIAEDRALDET